MEDLNEFLSIGGKDEDFFLFLPIFKWSNTKDQNSVGFFPFIFMFNSYFLVLIINIFLIQLFG